MTASRAGWVEDTPPTVLVDASAPEALCDTVARCRRTGAALVYCVSNVPTEESHRLAALSAEIPVVVADNLSLGHWLQTRMIRMVAGLTASMPRSPRMSVHERHPVTKRDRPSASARSLMRAWMESAPPGSVGETTSQRSGQPVSDHVVTFDLPGMSLSIEHSVSDLSAAASCLLDVIEHVRRLPPGLHPIHEVYALLYARAEVRHGDRAAAGDPGQG
ncbi:dihydrodipicolinate reductase [Actinoalloteichus hymeniacidonis]|uniref:Dihydrodipicolinate reductase n=2 Tax=Actinoalloteichus hymeniacidonis TaxID=340345 RepID=A0AAC9HR86_9PSEU|nr:dihydrodipicolinate reductase [Actinoalloteichus hymeniacidonis]